MARVQIIKEVPVPYSKPEHKGSALSFQWCRYVYDDGNSELGYRFIWRDPNGSLLPSRGQARIPSLAVLKQLVVQAENEGWGKEGGKL